ncbi:MAG: metallopeptidase family protein [Nitriliruptoraceae bacterium]
MDDRHARQRLRTADVRRRPIDGFRTTDTARFDRLVDDALRTLPTPLLDQLRGVVIQVADIPPPDPFGHGDEVLLVRYEPEPHAGSDRLTLYRRPLESRARSKGELTALVREAVLHEVAHHLGIDDDGIEDLGWS